MSRLTEYNKADSCFEIHVYGERAFIECKKKDEVIYMIHTEVPEALRGHKIGETLVREALEICSESGWQVVPICPFVLKFMKANTEFQKLVRAKDFEKYFGSK